MEDKISTVWQSSQENVYYITLSVTVMAGENQRSSIVNKCKQAVKFLFCQDLVIKKPGLTLHMKT